MAGATSPIVDTEITNEFSHLCYDCYGFQQPEKLWLDRRKALRFGIASIRWWSAMKKLAVCFSRGIAMNAAMGESIAALGSLDYIAPFGSEITDRFPRTTSSCTFATDLVALNRLTCGWERSEKTLPIWILNVGVDHWLDLNTREQSLPKQTFQELEQCSLGEIHALPSEQFSELLT